MTDSPTTAAPAPAVAPGIINDINSSAGAGHVDRDSERRAASNGGASSGVIGGGGSDLMGLADLTENRVKGFLELDSLAERRAKELVAARGTTDTNDDKIAEDAVARVKLGFDDFKATGEAINEFLSHGPAQPSMIAPMMHDASGMPMGPMGMGSGMPGGGAQNPAQQAIIDQQNLLADRQARLKTSEDQMDRLVSQYESEVDPAKKEELRKGMDKLSKQINDERRGIYQAMNRNADRASQWEYRNTDDQREFGQRWAADRQRFNEQMLKDVVNFNQELQKKWNSMTVTQTGKDWDAQRKYSDIPGMQRNNWFQDGAVGWLGSQIFGERFMTAAPKGIFGQWFKTRSADARNNRGNRSGSNGNPLIFAGKPGGNSHES